MWQVRHSREWPLWFTAVATWRVTVGSSFEARLEAWAVRVGVTVWIDSIAMARNCSMQLWSGDCLLDWKTGVGVLLAVQELLACEVKACEAEALGRTGGMACKDWSREVVSKSSRMIWSVDKKAASWFASSESLPETLDIGFAE